MMKPIILYDGYGRRLSGEWYVLYYRVRNDTRAMYFKQKETAI